MQVFLHLLVRHDLLAVLTAQGAGDEAVLTHVVLVDVLVQGLVLQVQVLQLVQLARVRICYFNAF